MLAYKRPKKKLDICKKKKTCSMMKRMSCRRDECRMTREFAFSTESSNAEKRPKRRQRRPNTKPNET